jgi:hypothetical protein
MQLGLIHTFFQFIISRVRPAQATALEKGVFVFASPPSFLLGWVFVRAKIFGRYPNEIFPPPDPCESRMHLA